MCLLAVLGLQGIVVKCTAAIFFPYGRFFAREEIFYFFYFLRTPFTTNTKAEFNSNNKVTIKT